MAQWLGSSGAVLDSMSLGPNSTTSNKVPINARGIESRLREKKIMNVINESPRERKSEGRY